MEKEQPNYYAIIPANIRYDNNLKANEKLLYWEITCLTQSSWKCFASNKYFADLYWVTTQCVSWWINKLGRLWYINIELVYAEDSKQIINRYIKIDWYPIKEKINTPINNFINTPINKKIKDNNTSINNTRDNNTSSACENFSSITSKEIKTPVDSLKHWTKTIRDLLSILVEKKIMSAENFSRLNLKEIEEYFIEHALIHLSGFKKKLPATMPDELMTDEEYFSIFDCERTIIESRMVLYYWEDWKEELKRRRKEFDEQTEAAWYDWVDLLFSKLETMIDWCIRNNREIKNLKTTFLTFIKPKKFK